MKKIVGLSVILLFSLNCMAGSHRRTITINNHTKGIVTVRDKDNHQVKIPARRSGSLEIKVNEPHGSLFPSSLMPHVTVITVTDDKGENTIKVDEHTQSITIDTGLELSKK